MGEAVEKAEVVDVINEDVISRKTILEKYINADPTEIDDVVLQEFVRDRKLARDMLQGHSAEMKQLLDKLQDKATRLHADINAQNSKMKYIDDKIVERHIRITGVGK